MLLPQDRDVRRRITLILLFSRSISVFTCVENVPVLSNITPSNRSVVTRGAHVLGRWASTGAVIGWCKVLYRLPLYVAHLVFGFTPRKNVSSFLQGIQRIVPNCFSHQVAPNQVSFRTKFPFAPTSRRPRNYCSSVEASRIRR